MCVRWVLSLGRGWRIQMDEATTLKLLLCFSESAVVAVCSASVGSKTYSGMSTWLVYEVGDDSTTGRLSTE